MEKVLVGMSGGVDSSVAAALLINLGFYTAGVTLKLYCNAENDCIDAKNVCESLNIPHFTVDLKQRFTNTVIKNFTEEYRLGRTPNTCIVCNKNIKFGDMIKNAEELCYGKIATGHYAQIKLSNGRYLLTKPEDIAKDQTYVLYCLSQESLSKTVFPLGSLTKSQVRDLADEYGFKNAHKPDSQDICFVPDGDYAKFIETFEGKTFPSGDFVDTLGNKVGTHSGIINYTIGQRKGLGIALGKPVFVLNKDVTANTVTVGDEDGLFYKRVEVNNINYIPFDKLNGDIKIKAKLRYRHTEQPAVLHPTSENTAVIEFNEPQRAPSAGQSAVFYDNDTVLGGGIIERGVK